MTTEMMLMKNESLNSSLLLYGDDDRDVVYQKTVDTIERVASPIVIGLGLAGNAVGSATLLRVAGLRCRGAGHLLVAVCVSDAVFLISLLATWLGPQYGRDYDLYNSDGWCELLSLTTMSSNFLSTWFTVALGVERYIAVQRCCRYVIAVNGRENLKSTMTKTSCGPTRTRVAIIALTVLAIVVYVNMVVNIGVATRDDGLAKCGPLQPAFDAMRVLLIKVDLIFNVIAPHLIIIGLYSTVGVRLAAWNCRRRQAANRLQPPMLTEEEDRAVSLTEIRLIKTAILLSAVVVLLSAPSHAMRTVYVVAEMFRLPVPAWIGGSAVQLVVHELFYASFAVPFFVVIASHRRIRRSIVLSLQLALESLWKRLQVVWCGYSWQASSQTTEIAEL